MLGSRDFNHNCQTLASAAEAGDLELMKFMIANGADLDGRNAWYDVALISAFEGLQFDAVKLLVESGANVNIPNAFGTSPYIAATMVGDMELIVLLIENGADLNKNYHNTTSSAKPNE